MARPGSTAPRCGATNSDWISRNRRPALGRALPEVSAKWIGDKLGGAGTLAAKSAKGAVKRALDDGRDMRSAFIAGAAAATAETVRKSLKDGALRRLGRKTFDELSPAGRERFNSVALNVDHKGAPLPAPTRELAGRCRRG